ncbi:unnamed protein product (macronuclear) [Paramecium tetraurelia]|uniref:Anaphase-promoting complex subunit 4 WD40 domain-containing protein n=1 Tax=Paramecium tetraurelia TaxID=5888 RepID=A0BTA5_PARTE|nr:uncharacterized protein GSPATT00032004001 [Paramecium tetraurelia]CAK61772.1 unnamed protein product [Paramecium tetraurelia]|eukprot:XP_001429170.1 hypothetical protein (macronuclear) [Paramecium tetraurelia strain d4-2]
MSENYNELKCIEHHNQVVTTILIDRSRNKNERFLCQECFDNTLQGLKSISIVAMQKIIEDKQMKRRVMINEIADQYISIIQQYNLNLENLKTKFTSSIEMMINTTQNWMRELNQTKQDSRIYSFCNELEDYIRSTEQYLHTFQFDFFDKINFSQLTKLKIGIKQLIEANYTHQYKVLFQKLRDIKDQRKQVEKQEWQLSKDGSIKLEQISTPIKQDKDCQALAFNATGNILVTSNDREIIIWNFNRGVMSFCQKQQLSNIINCLVFSKQLNVFISGCIQIICWKEKSSNFWEKSIQFQEKEKNEKENEKKNNEITCLVLNSKEDQIIYGSRSQIINILAVDLRINKLEFLYFIKMSEGGWVSALSLNPSENLLLSCGYGNKIMIWKKQKENKWVPMTEPTKYQDKYKEDPCKAIFVEDDEFILFDSHKQFYSSYKYYQKDKIVKQNYKRDFTDLFQSLLLQSFDLKLEKNLLFALSKDCIYILRKKNNGQYNIALENHYQTNANIWNFVQQWLISCNV